MIHRKMRLLGKDKEVSEVSIRSKDLTKPSGGLLSLTPL